MGIKTQEIKWEIEEWDYCCFKNRHFDINNKSEFSFTEKCRFCDFGLNSYKCRLYDVPLATIKADCGRRRVPKRCGKCMMAEK